jgi:hypothetical protein
MNTVTVPTITSFKSNLVFDDGVNTQIFTDAIEYCEDKTPIVSGVDPKIGDIYGGYNITISGDYLNISTPKVNIDDKECVVSTSNKTQIKCTVSQRLALPSEVKF